MKLQRVKEIAGKFSGKKILTVGDIMLDEYIWGNVDRISPEAPVPVVEVIKESYHLGGAANVAHNLKTLGAEVFPVGLIGFDSAGDRLSEIFESLGISCEGIFREKSRNTTQKTRIIAHSQHVVRVDREKKLPASKSTAEMITGFCEKFIPVCDAILIEDYDKGLLNPELINYILKKASSCAKPVFVDPKFENFFCYSGVKLFKPNLKELSKATGNKCSTEDEIHSAVDIAMKRVNCDYLLLTLGDRGMSVFFSDGREPIKIPTKAREVYDVSGAGDTVISAVCLSLLSGAGIEESALIGSHAAAVQLKKIGAQTVIIGEILESFGKHEN
ncbi:D-glycero-beta-D-manno-heptose-7-phosphate kinase [candidate division WOR-3 bacterium]|nr:D-glycero-beta-D-manno-heptose-7-phosphate kinase [candidate division WOR-3 bacterium]